MLDATPHVDSILVSACPACGERGAAHLGDATSFIALDGDDRRTHPAYAALRCRSCDLVYKSRTPDDHTLDRYYDQLDFAPFAADEDFPTDRLALSIARAARAGASILDYGCSVGRFLGMIGGDHVLYGVEPNRRAAERAALAGVRMLDDDAIRFTGPFDVIMVMDVFEHLRRPTETLERLAAALGPGGRMVIVTGLVDAAPPAFIAEYWYFRIYGHLQMASEAHLRWLGRRLNLTCERLTRASHYRRTWTRSARQSAQSFAYWATRPARPAPLRRLVAATPFLGRAARWTNMPQTDQQADHVVACYRKPSLAS